MRFIRDHQLACALLLAIVLFQVLSAIASPERFSPDYWSQLFMGCSDGSITAFLVLVLGERLREKGSEQGRD